MVISLFQEFANDSPTPSPRIVQADSTLEAGAEFLTHSGTTDGDMLNGIYHQGESPA
jgi:hypothetical protein